MNLTKFVIIDISLILFSLPFVLIWQTSKAKASLIGNLKSYDELEPASIKLPEKKELVELEKIVKKDGSGIESESLIGLWKFLSVWKKDTDTENLISSNLLRLFSATLHIKKDKLHQFAIISSIEFGLLSIRFVGSGNLKGKQPLLYFFFKHIELKAGSNVLYSKLIKIPEENKRPFFGLISMGKDGNWLSARGRGGGLALWVKG